MPAATTASGWSGQARAAFAGSDSTKAWIAAFRTTCPASNRAATKAIPRHTRLNGFAPTLMSAVAPLRDHQDFEALRGFRDDLANSSGRQEIGRIRRDRAARQQPQAGMLGLDDMAGDRVVGREELAQADIVVGCLEGGLAQVGVDQKHRFV